MIEVEGRWFYRALSSELIIIDPSCNLITDFMSVEGIQTGKVRITMYDGAKESSLLTALSAHDADAALAVWNARQSRKDGAKSEVMNIPGWATMTTVEIIAWYESNVDSAIASFSNLEEARQAMQAVANVQKKLIRLACGLRDHEGIF